MKTLFVRYLNEIVGLTLMALMTLAFAAAQADADFQRAAVEEVRQVVEVRVDTDELPGG